MKQIASNYSFDASERKVTVQGLTIPLERLLLIVNATRNQIIYNLTGTGHPTQPLGASASTSGGNTVFTLAFDTTGFLDSDKLSIFYDDGTNGGNTIDAGNLTITGIESAVEIKNDEGNPVPVTGSVVANVTFPSSQDVVVKNSHLAPVLVASPSGSPLNVFGSDVQIGESYGTRTHSGTTATTPFTIDPKYQWVAVKVTNASATNSSYQSRAQWGSDLGFTDEFNENEHFIEGMVYDTFARSQTAPKIATDGKWMFLRRRASYLRFRGIDAAGTNTYEVFGANILARPLPSVVDIKSAPTLASRIVDGGTAQTAITVKDANSSASTSDTALVVALNPTSNAVRVQDGSGNGLTSSSRGTQRALSVQVVDASGTQVTSFNGGAVSQSGNWFFKAQDGTGNPLTSMARGTERALSVQVVNGSGEQITSFGSQPGAITREVRVGIPSITGTPTSTQIAATNLSRKYLLIQSLDPTGTIYLSFTGGTPTTNSFQLLPRASIVFEGSFIPTGQVNGGGSSNNAAVFVLEA